MGFLTRRSSGLDKAAQALAAAGGVAHVAFFSIFAWRVITSGMAGRFVYIACAFVALVGLACEVVGWSLVKHGGRTPAKTLGLWSIAASTALAAVLLVVASHGN
jgi:hypothetical protein